MTYYIEGAVAIEEIAQVLHRRKPATVEAEARALGMTVGTDWAGRTSVSEADAAGLVSGRARIDHTEQAKIAELQRRADEWMRERMTVVIAASERVRTATYTVGVSAGDAIARGSAAGAEAGREFEKHLPRELAPYVNRIYGTALPDELADTVM